MSNGNVFPHDSYSDIVKGNNCEKSHDIRRCLSCFCKHYAAQHLWYIPPVFPYCINKNAVNSSQMSLHSLYKKKNILW